MAIFLSVVLYLAIILISVFLIIKIKNLSRLLKEHTQQINELDKKMYTDLRMAQYKAMDITKQANKYINGKNSILSEAVSAVALAVLPFKKLKSIIYLHKLGNKVLK